MAIQWRYMAIQWRYMAIQWRYNGDTMAIHGDTMAIQWRYNGDTMAIQRRHNGEKKLAIARAVKVGNQAVRQRRDGVQALRFLFAKIQL